MLDMVPRQALAAHVAALHIDLPPEPFEEAALENLNDTSNSI
jgi:hypothetical protein